MPNSTAKPNNQQLLLLIDLAKQGDTDALEKLVKILAPTIYQLALRFLWHPQDAEDAHQEILVRIITHLDNFRGDSQVRTWVYRVAANHLMTLKKKNMESHAMGFNAFGQDLLTGLEPPSPETTQDPEYALLLQEIKIGCTTAMLVNLDRAQRLAYILGEILELDHSEAAEITDTNPATFRKRLSRARLRVNEFMLQHCGLVNPDAACHCSARLTTAKKLGRINPERLLFTSATDGNAQAQSDIFANVERKVQQLERDRRAAALYRSHPEQRPQKSMNEWLKSVLRNYTDNRSLH